MVTEDGNGFTSILVTGGEGQLGKALQELSGQITSGIFHFYSRRSLDISRPDDIQKAILACRPGLVINAAAYTAVDKAESEEEQAFLVNRDGARNVAIACRKHGIPLIHISTDYVYHNELRRPLLETDPVLAKGVYARSKLQGEQAVAEAQPDSLIIRTSWLYGVYGHNFVKTMLRLGSQGRNLSVVDDQTGSPTCVHDLANAVLELGPKLIKRDIPPGIYNFSNEGETTWYEFALRIFEFAKMKVELKSILSRDYPTPATRPNWSVLDCHKIRNYLKNPIPSWDESLHHFMPRIIQEL